MHPWYGLAFYFLADAASDPANLGILAQYGLLGFVTTGAIVFGRVSYKRELERADRELARADRLEAEVTRLNNMVIDRAIPALTAAAQAAEHATQLIRDMQRLPPPRRPRSGGEER